MGRNRKYFNIDEIKKANSEKSMRYYIKNSESIKQKAKERYEKNKKR